MFTPAMSHIAVDRDSGKKTILFVCSSPGFSLQLFLCITIAAVVELQICLINNKTEQQPKSRVSVLAVRGSWPCLCFGQFLQLVPSVRTLIAPVALVAFRKGWPFVFHFFWSMNQDLSHLSGLASCCSSVRKGCCQVVFAQLTQGCLGHSYFLSSSESFVGLYL